MSFFYDYLYGDPQARLADLRKAIKIMEPTAGGDFLALGDRLIRPRTSMSPQDVATSKEFIALTAENEDFFTQVPCTYKCRHYTLGDLLLAAGQAAQSDSDHETALKIYAHATNLDHSPLCTHTTTALEARKASLLALGYPEGADLMPPWEFKEYYSQHPDQLEKLIKNYEREGRHTDVINKLYPDFTQPLITTLTRYIAQGISDPLFPQLLTTVLSKQPLAEKQRVLLQLEADENFPSALVIHEHLHGTLTPSIYLNYGKKALESENYNLACGLFKRGIELMLSQKESTPPHELLITLYRSAEILDKEDEIISVIAAFLQHPRYDMKCFLEQVMPCLSTSFIQKLTIFPKIAHYCYTMLLEAKKEAPLTHKDLDTWFLPLIASYIARKETHKATALLIKELEILGENSGRDAVRNTLTASLQNINPQVSQQYYEQCLYEKTSSLLSEEDIKAWFTGLIDCYQTQGLSHNALDLVKTEINALQQAPHQERCIILLCDLLLKLAPKDPHAFFCRGIARYKDAMNMANTDQDTLIYDDEGKPQLNLDQYTLSIIVEDLKQAYHLASGKTKQLYLVSMIPFLKNLEAMGHISKEHRALMEDHEKSYAIYQLGDGGKEQFVPPEDPFTAPPASRMQISQQEARALNPKRAPQAPAMDALYRQINKQLQDMRLYHPIQQFYAESLAPYIYSNHGSAPRIDGYYAFEDPTAAYAPSSLSEQALESPPKGSLRPLKPVGAFKFRAPSHFYAFQNLETFDQAFEDPSHVYDPFTRHSQNPLPAQASVEVVALQEQTMAFNPLNNDDFEGHSAQLGRAAADAPAMDIRTPQALNLAPIDPASDEGDNNELVDPPVIIVNASATEPVKSILKQNSSLMMSFVGRRKKQVTINPVDQIRVFEGEEDGEDVKPAYLPQEDTLTPSATDRTPPHQSTLWAIEETDD